MIIYGKQVCLYALSKHQAKVQKVYLAKKGLLPQPIYDRFKEQIKFLDNKWAQAMSKGGNHQGILIELDDIEFSDFSEIKKSNFIVILDTLTDTGNIGAIVRSAYALGADAIIASGVKQLNMAAITRTSSGALLDMPFLIADNILDSLNELHQLGFVSYGASMRGISVESVTFVPKRVLILGSEGKGFSKRIESKILQEISIDMKHGFDSLNVSAAAAILLHRMVHGVK